MMNPLKIFNRWKPVTWYSYGEIVSSRVSLDSIAKPYLAEDDPWLECFDRYHILMEEDNQTFKPYLEDLTRELYARYYTHMVFNDESKEDYGLDVYNRLTDKCDEFIGKVVMIIVQTYDRYAELLKMYQDNKAQLLASVKISTDSVGQFNDTPQNVQDVEEEFGDNSHISNLTKSKQDVTSDVKPIMDRIDDINRKYRNLIRDWTNEFDGLFLESENIV